MRRRQLYRTLKKLEPSLARRRFIPAFACVWFDGERVMAYNDIMAIEAPCAFSFRGGIEGVPLLNHLANSSGSHVEAKCDGDEVLITAGDSTLRLAIYPRSDLDFTFPDETGVVFDVDESIIDALSKCVVSAGYDPAHAWRLGMTIVFEKGRITVYSADLYGASRAILEREVSAALVGRRFVIGASFWQAFLKLDKYDFAETIKFTDDWVETQFSTGVRLWIRTVKKREYEVAKFDELFDVAALDEAAFIPIPPDFRSQLRQVFSATDRQDPLVMVAVVHSDSGPRLVLGSVNEMFHGTTSAEYHPEASVKCDPNNILRVLEHVDHLCIMPNEFLGFRGEGFVHLMAVQRKSGDKEKAITCRVTHADRALQFLHQLFGAGQVRRSAVVKRAAEILGLCWENVEKLKKLAGIVSERAGGLADRGHWVMRSLRPVSQEQEDDDRRDLTGVRRKHRHHTAAQLAYRIAEYEIDPPPPEPPESEEYWERLAAERSDGEG